MANRRGDPAAASGLTVGAGWTSPQLCHLAGAARPTIRKERAREDTVLYRKSMRALKLAGALAMMVGAAQASDGAKYPDWRGAWERWFPPNAVLDPYNGVRTAGGQPSFDQVKPWGPGQDAPLTPEYQKDFEEIMAHQARGGEGNFFDHSVRCMPGGMPLMTIAFTPLEFVVTPAITFVLTGYTEPNPR